VWEAREREGGGQGQKRRNNNNDKDRNRLVGAGAIPHRGLIPRLFIWRAFAGDDG
jgi:hypothetical protein